MSNNKINVVIVGVGHDHAHDAFEYITRSDSSFNLLGIVVENDNNGNYQKYKNSYDMYHLFTVEEVLSLQNLDAVIIECDDTLLSTYALMFASAGIPIHMDKPGGQDKKEFDSLIDMVRCNGSVLHLGYMYRYNTSVMEAIKICKSGAIGKIYSVEAHMSINLSVEKRKWLSKFKGGMMNYLGCHLIDIAVQLLGKPTAVIPFNSKTCDTVGKDLGFAILKYGEHVSQINTSAIEYDGFSRRHITICGEKMTIDISPTETFVDGKFYSVSTYKCSELLPGVPCGQIKYEPIDRYENMFEEFASIVKKEIKNPYSLEHEQMVHDTLLLACGD